MSHSGGAYSQAPCEDEDVDLSEGTAKHNNHHTPSYYEDGDAGTAHVFQPSFPRMSSTTATATAPVVVHTPTSSATVTIPESKSVPVSRELASYLPFVHV